jgi:hypothetical protein
LRMHDGGKGGIGSSPLGRIPLSRHVDWCSHRLTPRYDRQIVRTVVRRIQPHSQHGCAPVGAEVHAGQSRQEPARLLVGVGSHSRPQRQCFMVALIACAPSSTARAA